MHMLFCKPILSASFDFICDAIEVSFYFLCIWLRLFDKKEEPCSDMISILSQHNYLWRRKERFWDDLCVTYNIFLHKEDEVFKNIFFHIHKVWCGECWIVGRISLLLIFCQWVKVNFLKLVNFEDLQISNQNLQMMDI